MLHSRPQSRDMAAWNIRKVRSIQLAEGSLVSNPSCLKKEKWRKKRMVKLKAFLKVLPTRCGCWMLPANWHMKCDSKDVLSHGFPPPWAVSVLHLWHCILIPCGAPGKKFCNGRAARGRGNGPLPWSFATSWEHQILIWYDLIAYQKHLQTGYYR